MVNSDDCGDSIFLDFDRKMGKEKRYETTIPRKLIDCCKTLSNSGIVLGVTVMNKKKEQKREKKLEGVVVKPENSRDLIRKNLMEMFKKQGIKVKKG